MNKQNRVYLIILLIVLSCVGTACQLGNVVDKLSSYEQKWTFKQGETSSLVFDSEYDASIDFIKSPDGTNYVEISGNMEQNTIDQLKATEITGDTLDVKLQKAMKIVATPYKSTKLRIIVALTDDTQLERISYDLHSGNVSLTHVEAKHIDVSVFSGDVKMDGLKGALTVESTSGNITAADVVGTADVSLHAGDIKFDRFTGNGVFQVTSGNVTLTEQRSDLLDISVRSGQVALSPDPEFKGFFDLKTTTGRVIAPDPLQETTDVIKVRVISGHIRIQ